MKQILTCLVALVALATVAGAANPCITIQSGLLVYQPNHFLAGKPISTGVNVFGYNYQAHLFNGTYFNAYAGADGLPPYDGNDAAYLAANPSAANHWAWPYRGVDVAMKWNDSWLSNQDCDGDGLLDRHFGKPSYIGTDAWLTNHTSWPVIVGNKTKRAGDFIKIIAIPTGAVVASPVSYFGELTVYLNNKVLGPQIWGEMAVIEYVLNDPSTGDNGVMIKSQIAAGFGKFRP